MNRRTFLNATAGLACSTLALAWSGAAAQPALRVSLETLQQAIAGRFPIRSRAGDLFSLEVESPRLRLLPELNRLASQMAIEATGGVLGRSYRGSFEIEFALRYEASDQSIRAHDLRAHSFRLPGVAPQTLRLLEAYGQAVAEQSLLEVVLHRLRPRDLALADVMGLQPGSITVASDGLVIGFVPKQPP